MRRLQRRRLRLSARAVVFLSAAARCESRSVGCAPLYAAAAAAAAAAAQWCSGRGRFTSIHRFSPQKLLFLHSTEPLFTLDVRRVAALRCVVPNDAPPTDSYRATMRGGSNMKQTPIDLSGSDRILFNKSLVL